MKKILALVLALALCLTAFSVMAEGTKVKIGFIFLHDENSTYDLNFINAAKEACASTARRKPVKSSALSTC